jgi:cyclopropane-fatty-acyl-phospholipid synthase
MGTMVETKAPAQLGAAGRTFLALLDEYVTDATITFVVNGSEHAVGRKSANGQLPNDIRINVHRDRFFDRVLSEANLGIGESYMDGDFDMAYGEVADFLTILLRNRLDQRVHKNWRLSWKVLSIRIANLFRGREGNIHQAYDVGADLFKCFLDPTMMYSCAYANSDDEDLEQIQLNKLDRICRKLRLQPGERLLDIGCGFAGLLIYAAQNYGTPGVGVTLSNLHRDLGRERVRELGLEDKIRIEYLDYLKLDGKFDKVVSVGMVEHVPRPEYRQYFGTIARVLEPVGMGLVQTAGTSRTKNEHDPFIQKYILPDSNQLRLSEIANHLEHSGLAVLDVENMKPHYAHTARGWLRNFRRNRHSLDPKKYDERFSRMWEYYLACAITAAQASDAALFQVLFTKDYTAPVPLHRV